MGELKLLGGYADDAADVTLPRHAPSYVRPETPAQSPPPLSSALAAVNSAADAPSRQTSSACETQARASSRGLTGRPEEVGV